LAQEQYIDSLIKLEEMRQAKKPNKSYSRPRYKWVPEEEFLEEKRKEKIEGWRKK
jgi:hypothetical protein